MSRTFAALHVGVDVVDPSRYTSPPPRLHGAEADAHALAQRTHAAGLTPRVLVGPSATRAQVLALLEEAATTTAPGELFVLSFSGHGAQDGDEFSDQRDDELDGLDELWCLADDFVLDDEIYAALARFAFGVRILVIVDACHAGTSLEALAPTAPGAVPRVYPRGDAASSLQDRAGELRARAVAVGRRPPVNASVILLAATTADGVAYERDAHGVFSAAFCALWDSGVALSHPAFLEAVKAACPDQTPSYEFIAPQDTDFAAQRPLTVAPPQRSVSNVG